MTRPNLIAAASDIARASSFGFDADEQPVLVDALVRYLSCRDLPVEGPCLLDAAQADALIEAALLDEAAACQSVPDIESTAGTIPSTTGLKNLDTIRGTLWHASESA